MNPNWDDIKRRYELAYFKDLESRFEDQLVRETIQEICELIKDWGSHDDFRRSWSVEEDIIERKKDLMFLVGWTGIKLEYMPE